jgi:uncharacterized protein
MPEKLKTSNYNFLFDLDDGTHMAFNAMSGGFAKIDDANHETVKRMIEKPGEFEPKDDNERKLWEDVKRARFVLEDDVSELDLLRYRSNYAKYANDFLHLTIMPTMDCNFACPYCYENPVKGKMTKKKQEALILWVKEKLTVARLMGVGWFGGEPLMAFDVMKNLSHRFQELCEEKDAKYTSSITTNAYYLTQKVINEFEGMGITLVQLTFDGPPEVHDKWRVLKTTGKGSFDRIRNNLIHLCETIENIHLVIRVNFDADSYDSIPDLFPLIPDLIRDKSEIYFRQVFPPPLWWDADKATKHTTVDPNSEIVDSTGMYKIAQDHGFRVLINNFSPQTGYCEADYVNHMVIDPELNIHKCTVAFDEEHRVGYVTPEGKAKMDIPMLAKWMLRETVERPNCKVCDILPLCMGGCNFNTLCSKGRTVCSTTLNTEAVIDNLKMLYKNTQLLKSRQAAVEEPQPVL